MLQSHAGPAAMPARFFPGFAPQPGGGDPPAAPAIVGDPPATPPVTPPATPPAAPPATPPATPPAAPELPADVQAKLKEYDALKAAKEQFDREAMTETDRLKAERDEANARALASDRRAVAARLGLPAEVADRLKGSSLEEIEADAKALAPLFAQPQAKGNTGTPPGGDPPPAPNATDLQKKEAELADAVKRGRRLDILRLETEVAKLKAQQKKA